MKSNKRKLICTGMGSGDLGCNELILVDDNTDVFAQAEESIATENYWYYFRCPHCGQKTEIPEEELTKGAKSIALSMLFS